MNMIKIQYPGEFATVFPMISNGSYATDLEQIFAEWNHGSEKESNLCINSRCRSLSVNDFVCINDCWFQCASVGWRPVTQEFVDKIEAEVRAHPTLKEHGGWSALHDVMRNYKHSFQANVSDNPITVPM